MARRRSIEVRESFEELAQLREYYTDTPNEPYIHLLQLFKEDPTRTIPECAEICGLSKRKAERVWKAYREGGMTQLLDPHYRERQHLDTVTTTVREAGMALDVTLLNHIGKVLACEALNEWLLEMRALLYRLFPEIDYIFLRVLTLPDHYSGEAIRTVAGRIVFPDGSQQVISASEGNRNYDASRYLSEAARLGIPLSEYRDQPEVIEIFPDGNGGNPNCERNSIATFLFFRKKSRGPVPESVLHRVELLRPFLTSVILRFARRHVPVDEGWTMLESAIERVSSDKELSHTEKRVLLLSLCGMSPQKIADDVSVAISTIRSHLRSIYQKLGVSSRGEAFAVLFGIRS